MRTRLDSIFVPIDESVAATQSVTLARSMNPQQITLFHAIDPPPSYIRDVLFPFAGMGSDMNAVEHEMLKTARNSLAKKFQIEKDKTIELDIAVGRHDAISERLRGSDADLVIVGAYGSNGSRFDAIGDVANSVISESKKPVFVLRDQPVVKKALVCIDLSAHSVQVLETALTIATEFDCEMETMFVVTDGKDDTRQLLQTGQNENPQKAINRSKERIDALFDRTIKELDLKFGEHNSFLPRLKSRHLAHGNIGEQVLDRIQKTDVDLLIIGASHPDSSHIGSNALAFLRRAPVNVLIVP